MKKIYLLTTLAVFLIVYSCNSPEKGTAETKDDTKIEQTVDEEVVSDRPADSKGKFLVKSAVIEFDSEMMSMKQKMVMFTENWGELNFVEMKGEFMGKKTHNISIVNGGFEYALDMTKKTGTKRPAKVESNPNDIDFTALTPAIMKEFNMKNEGKEVFLSKNCDRYSVNNTLTKMKGYYLVWMGIPLKTDITFAGMNMKMTATKIDLKPTIPANKFDIPKDIKITEEAPRTEFK